MLVALQGESIWKGGGRGKRQLVDRSWEKSQLKKASIEKYAQSSCKVPAGLRRLRLEAKDLGSRLEA